LNIFTSPIGIFEAELCVYKGSYGENFFERFEVIFFSIYGFDGDFKFTLIEKNKMKI